MQEKQSPACPVPDSPHTKAVRLFIRVMRRHHACMERRIGDLGIHHSQHRMLMQLVKSQESPPSQKELAEAMGISPAAVTASLKKLEKEGYVSRSMTDEDNRRNEIRITEEGLARINAGHAAFDATDLAMFADFTAEEMAQLTTFWERLDRNRDAVGAPVDPPPPPPPDRKSPHPNERK